MRVLYAIQGTGNGHLSRAREIIPILNKKCDLDILISGNQADVHLDHPIKYRFKGLSFIFGKKGGVDLLKTFTNSNLKLLKNDIHNLPVQDYDLILNDFEPVSAWAAQKAKIPCIALSHQAAVLDPKAPKPKKSDIIGKQILKYYAPSTIKRAFHFQSYSEDIYTPVIRSEIRNLTVKEENRYVVYLPAYSDKKIIKMLSPFENTLWEVYSKHTKKGYRKKNIIIRKIENSTFVNSLVSCTGVLCGAGFETPAEALFLQKKLMVIPMKGQYEQQCNARALELMGIPVLKSLKKKHSEKIKTWINSTEKITVNYPDCTEAIIDDILNYHINVAQDVLCSAQSDESVVNS